VGLNLKHLDLRRSQNSKVEVNTEIRKDVFMSDHKNAGENHKKI
jgi:hypothetical protein